MPSTNLAFTVEEYQQRLAKVRHSMSEQCLDLLLVTDPSNMNWLTGYDGWSFYVHQCVIISHEHDPFWYGRLQDVQGATRTVWMEDRQLLHYPDHYVQSPERHPMDLLSQLLQDLGLALPRIGVELDNYYYSAAAHASLTRHLATSTLLEATALVNWCRAVKSAQELDYMRRAARIVERMHQRILEVAEPGMRKCDLVAEILATAVRGTPDFGGDYAAIVPLLPSGADAAAPHLTWDDQPLRTNEGTFFEIAGCYRRYHAPLSRTLYLGQPPEHFLEADKAVQEGMAAGLEQAKPGNCCEDIANAFFAVLQRYGIVKNNRTGYPIGLSYPPDWGERTMSLRPGDKTVLSPGMTFHFMTALWMEGWGLETTESIVITETGVECLANLPRHLFVKP